MMNGGKLPYTQIDGKRFVDREDILNLLPNKNEIEKQDSLEQKISILTNEIIRLGNIVEALLNNQGESKPSVSASENPVLAPFKKQQKISSNEIRARKAKMKLFEALNELKDNNSIPIYRGTPSITGIHRLTGIDRGTISKYIKEWMNADNNHKSNS